MEETQSLLNNDLHIDDIAKSYLFETAKWGKFLAILGFIMSGIVAIAAFFAGTILTSLNPYSNAAVAMGGGIITVVYLLIAVINFFMALFLFRFSQKMKIALEASDQLVLNESFFNLKRLYKLVGILTIVYLAFIAIIIIIAIIAAASIRR